MGATAMSATSRALSEAIRRWMAGFAAGVAELIELPVSADDEYGTELSLALRPTAPQACPIEVGITAPAAGAGTYIVLDSWEGIGNRFGLDVKRGKRHLVGLGVEPMALSPARLLDVCGRVAAGAVHLELVSRGQVLLGTAGHVPLRAGRFPLRGVTDVPVWAARVLAPLGFAVRRVEYGPWR